MKTASGVQIGTVSDSTRPLQDQIIEAVELGFDFFEVVVIGPYADLTVLRRQWEKLILHPKSLDLYFHLPWTLDIGSPMEPCRAGSVGALQEILAVGGELKVKKATVHPSSRSYYYWDRDTIDQKVMTSLRELSASADQSQIDLVVENISDFTLRDFHKIFNDTNTKMCLDTGHAIIHGSDELEIMRFITNHRERISHVHLNDNRRKRDDHLPLGYGLVDLQRIVGRFLELNWSGSLAIELHTHDIEYLRLSRRKLDSWISMYRR